MMDFKNFICSFFTLYPVLISKEFIALYVVAIIFTPITEPDHWKGLLFGGAIGILVLVSSASLVYNPELKWGTK